MLIQRSHVVCSMAQWWVTLDMKRVFRYCVSSILCLGSSNLPCSKIVLGGQTISRYEHYASKQLYYMRINVSFSLYGRKGWKEIKFVLVFSI